MFILSTLRCVPFVLVLDSIAFEIVACFIVVMTMMMMMIMMMMMMMIMMMMMMMMMMIIMVLVMVLMQIKISLIINVFVAAVDIKCHYHHDWLIPRVKYNFRTEWSRSPSKPHRSRPGGRLWVTRLSPPTTSLTSSVCSSNVTATTCLRQSLDAWSVNTPGAAPSQQLSSCDQQHQNHVE